MNTFQQFETMKSKGEKVFEKYIVDMVQDFFFSDFYINAVEAEKYYKGENTNIFERMLWFYDSLGSRIEDKFKANNKVASEFFRKIISQENSYLLGNGVTLDDKIKSELGGNKFDIKLQKMGLTALIEGVTWGYCFIDQNGKFDIAEFKGKEIIELLDERTGELKAAIRVIKGVDSLLPYFIEVYEMDGKTEYTLSLKENSLKLTEPKKPYKIFTKVDALEEKIYKVQNWNKIPLVPLYANELKRSEFTKALKSKIDIYDIINSDLANNLEDYKEILYMLKNYAGEDIGEFLADLKMYNVVKVDDEGGFDVKQQEVPHEARKLALEVLRKSIFDDSMSLDTDTIKGGSLTNVAIKSAMIDLDLKTDKFEWQAVDYITNILEFYYEHIGKVIDTNITFTRRNIVNDSEIIENIYKMRDDISHKTALKLNPYIEEVEKELEMLEAENMEKVKLNPIPPSIEEE